MIIESMDIPHINIQNVYDWVAAHKFIDVPYITPPWKKAVYMFRPRFDGIPITIPVFVKVEAFKINPEDIGRQMPGGKTIPENCAYLVHNSVYVSDQAILGDAVYWVDTTGAEVGTPGYKIHPQAREAMIAQGASTEDLPREVAEAVGLVIFANALSHCRNVELIDEPLSRQRRRLLERKGGIRYKILSIEPFKKQVRKEAAHYGESEMKRALHICRGHFATYTEDKPLFGKYAGTFWKAQHVRGSQSAGIIKKDYMIDTDA